MNNLTATITWLEGKKTYLVCAITVLSALLAFLNHQIDGFQLGEAVLAAIGGATIRHGVTTTAQKVIDANAAANAVTRSTVQATASTTQAVVVAAAPAAGGVRNGQPADPNDLG